MKTKTVLLFLFSLAAMLFGANAITAEAKNPAAGDIVNFGKFDGSDLSWLVLDVDEKNNRALLITENCVAQRKFSDTSKNDWAASSIRAYLNGTDSGNFFTDSNFSDEEKARVLKVFINSTTISKKSSEIVKSYGTDSVFLLSVRDANQYFSDNSARICNYNNSACRWWLRMSTQSVAKAGYVSSKGAVLSDGTGVTYSLCVRPAIWITLPAEDTNDSTDSGSSVTADANAILEMEDDAIRAKYEDKPNVAITGTLDSAETLSEILMKIGEVTDINNLDLRSLDISEVNLDNVNILNINLEDNKNIKKVKTQDSSVVSLNLSGSSVQEIEAKSCEFLEEVSLENCKSVNKINFSQNYYLNKLTVKGCESLTELSCESSDLINLDIEGCTSLAKLNVKNNSLPKLDAGKLTSLADFECGNQYLSRGLISSFNFNSFLQNSLIVSAAAVNASEENSDLSNVKNLKVYDESGNGLEYVLDATTGKITISGEPYKLTYGYDTGFNKNGSNILMDVTVEEGEGRKGGGDGSDDSSDSSDSSSGSSVGGSGGGCNTVSGMGIWIMFVAVALEFASMARKFQKTL